METSVSVKCDVLLILFSLPVESQCVQYSVCVVQLATCKTLLLIACVVNLRNTKVPVELSRDLVHVKTGLKFYMIVNFKTHWVIAVESLSLYVWIKRNYVQVNHRWLTNANA